MDSADFENRAREACWDALRRLPSPIDDHRLPPPDVLGHLADRNIRRSELQQLAEYVAHNWPCVQAVRCGVGNGERLYFSIHIEPFSEAAQHTHWALGDWIESTFGVADCDFLFLPPMEEMPYTPRISVYERSIASIQQPMPRAA